MKVWFKTNWREIAVSTIIILGWLLIVFGLAGLLTVWIWPIGIGVGLIALAGFRFFWTLVSIGIYTLSRSDDESAESGSEAD